MGEYEFEIQTLIKVTIEADDQEEARRKVCDLLHSGHYNDDLMSDCCVSDGDLLRGDKDI